jgi:coproporphyrinogen III oxidase-like Fe-S oxidoreductase
VIGAALPEARYLQALVADLEAALPLVWGRPVHTVFIGGGTPSLFSPEGIDRLIADIRARLPLAAAASGSWRWARPRCRWRRRRCARRSVPAW